MGWFETDSSFGFTHTSIIVRSTCVEQLTSHTDITAVIANV